MVVQKRGGVRTPWTPPLDPPLGTYTHSIIFRIRKYPEKYEICFPFGHRPRQLQMRLLHNTELYRVNITNSDYPSAQAFRYQNPMRLLHNTELCRVNSDYPSAQAFRYQNPTIGVLCLWGITEVA